MTKAAEVKGGLKRQYRLVRATSAGFVRATAIFCIGLGVLVLLGWFLDIPSLKSVIPGAVEMKANTAFAFVLLGAALFLSAAGRHRTSVATGMRVAQVLGALVAALGVVTIAEYLFGWNPGIDEALVRDIGTAYNRSKGRMSPYSALAFAIAGMSFAILPLVRWRPLVKAGAVMTTSVGFIALMGYLWGASELTTDAWAPPVAIHASVGFLFLGLGFLVELYKSELVRGSLMFLRDPVERKIFVGFAGSLLLMLVMGGWTYGSAAEYSQYSRQLVPLKAFHSRLTEFGSDTAEAAFAQRNYLLTGGAESLERWIRADHQLATSHRVVMDAALRVGLNERSEFTALDHATIRLIGLLHEGVDVYREQGPDAARNFVRTGVCTEALAGVREAMLSMGSVQGAMEESREEQLRRSQYRTLQITILSLLAAVAMLSTVFFAIQRETRARINAERETRRTSMRAQAANRFLESLVQNIPHMIFVKDAKDLRFVRMNRVGEKITGVSEEDLIGKGDRDFFPPDQAEHFIANDRIVLARGEILDIPREEIQGADGQTRILHTKKIPLYDAAGQPTHLLGISEDVTEAHEKERQISELNQALRDRAEEVERVNVARGTFLATMSHEIRTPMNGMLGMVELLDLTPLDEKQRQALHVVRESGQSLLRIIDDILDFSKIEAGRLELREEVASVAAILSEVRNIHSTVASSKGLVINVKLDPQLSPAMWVDSLRLRQVLNNLVSNAVKFTSHGHIDMNVEVAEQRDDLQTLRFSVTDTGAGVSPAEQSRLFEPFIQAGPGAASAGGTGLGLVISRRLTQLMGGTLEMTSVAGLGTSMTVVIPVRTAAPELLPPPSAQQIAELRDATGRRRSPPPMDEAAAEGTLVLLVDDHPVNRALLEQQLNTLGYAVQAAQDGQEALDLWRSGRFGLILTDCQMPGMTGYELARNIRQHEAHAGRGHVPIIACTALALPEERERCLQAGMSDVMFKPVGLRTMMEGLERWLPLPTQRPGDAIGIEAGRTRLNGSKVVDREYLEATWGSDEKRIQAILDSYVRSTREDIAELQRAIARRDLDAAMQMAHRMLGASRMVGARGISESCELIYSGGREKNWDALANAMDALDAEYSRLITGLSLPYGGARG